MIVVLVLGLLIGGVLGALGGGGAILTVPVLVYVLGEDVRDATAASLVIVGLTAVFGTAGHARSGNIRWGVGVLFGGVGAAAAVAGTAVNRRLDPDLLMLGFAALMGVAAVAMLLRSADVPDEERRDPAAGAAFARVAAAGAAAGFLTGLFGVGGGFVIVPALVLALRLPMPVAAGTSLLVIAVNSAASLAARGGFGAPGGGGHVDWAVVLPFTLAAIAGTVAGRRVAARLPAERLTRAFAVLLLAVAGCVAAAATLA